MQNGARLNVESDIRNVSLTCELDLNLEVEAGTCITITSELLAKLVLIPRETGVLEEGVSVVPVTSKISKDTFIVAFNEPFDTEDDTLLQSATVKYLKFAGVVVINSNEELKLEVEVSGA